MNFLLLGRGAIGRRHESILRDMGHIVTTVDPNPDTGADYQRLPRFTGIYSGVLDCTPPDVRASWRIPARTRFVEKPLGRKIPTSKLCPIQVGFCYRFDESLEGFVNIIKGRVARVTISGGQYLQDWHAQDYRTRDYWGVVLDSLPHSVYIARWILGDVKYVGSTTAHVSDLEIETEDVAGVLLRGPNGEPALLSADYLQRPRAFYIEAITNDSGWYRWEFCAKDADKMYRRQMEKFVQLCEGHAALGYPTLGDGLAVQGILDAVQGL